MKLPPLKPIVFLFVFAFYTVMVQAQWVRSIKGEDSEHAYAIETDVLGNVYIAGTFEATVDFDPTSTDGLLTSNGLVDVFVQKRNPSGKVLWTRSFGGEKGDGVRDIAVDEAGNVYIVGSFQDSVDFDPGADTMSLNAIGYYDIYVQKLSTDGDFQWAISVGSSDRDEGYSITTDSDGAVYFTGRFFDTVDFDPGDGVFKLTSPRFANGFVEKLDTDGNFLWAYSLEEILPNSISGIAADPAENTIYVCGRFGGTVDFDPGTGVENRTSLGVSDGFVQKLNANGELIWVRTIGSEQDVLYSESIVVDANGDVIQGGRFRGTPDFDPGLGVFEATSVGYLNFFIQKMDSDGNFIWANTQGDPEGSSGVVEVNADNEIFVAGVFHETVDFDPGSGVQEISSKGYSDIYLQKLDQAGNLEWVRTMGGTMPDYSSSCAINNLGDIFITGGFGGVVDFSPSSSNHQLTADGSFDVFVQKISRFPVGVPDLTHETDATFKVFPNPTSGEITLELNAGNNASLRITNLFGQEVYHQEQMNTGVQQQVQLPQAAGVYFVEITANGQRTVQRVVK